MKVAFLGSTKYSEEMLKSIMEIQEIEIEVIFSIPESFNISYSTKPVKNVNYAALEPYALNKNIDYFEIDSSEGSRLIDYYDYLNRLDLDVLLVLGWYYMVPEKIRNIAKHGAWGIHASLLPDYAGGAPLVWSIINGESETGVTLFRLQNGVDDGDIIEQESFDILNIDTIKDVYKKAIRSSKKILIKSLINADKINYTSQNKDDIKIYPQRKPEDGEIDLSWESKRLYDFIRAQTDPYPGAFIKTVDGKKLIIEKARIETI